MADSLTIEVRMAKKNKAAAAPRLKEQEKVGGTCRQVGRENEVGQLRVYIDSLEGVLT